MNLSSNTIEQVRQDLGLGLKEFCARIALDARDYAAFITADNLRNFPPRSVGLLRDLMLAMERENVGKFKAHTAARTSSHFQSAKILRHLDKVAMLQGGAPELAGPVTVEIHPTNVCNHRCPSCTFGIPEVNSRHKRGDGCEPWRSTLDMALVGPLLDDLCGLGVRGVILSGGGEPTLHPNICGILRAIRERGLDCGLVTNGSRLHSDGADHAELREAIVENCVWCRVSADAGSQESYEKMHGRSGAVDFDALVEGVALLAATKVRAGSTMTLGVSHLLTTENHLDLVQGARTFREIHGVDYFQVKPLEVPPVERGVRLDTIFWDRRIFDTLTMLGALEHEGFSVYTLGFKFIDMLLSETDGLPFSRCWGHPFYPTVCADGSVIVCCHMLEYVFRGSDVGVYGKLSATTSFREIWESEQRFDIGSGIAVRMCPSNCKLSETNKLLEQMNGTSPHSNFIS